jgi:hypothetical protein
MFSYKNDNHQDILETKSGMTFRIQKVHSNAARLFCINSEGNQIKLPEGLIVRNLESGNVSTDAIMTQFPIDNYMLTWFGNYSIEMHGKIIFKIENAKQQSIKMYD